MDQISVAQIREKFPMYSGVSDDDLIIAVRKKYYPEVPIQEFVKRIKYEAPNPTEGMSTSELFRAGMGKALADLARGAGQWVGATSRDDVAQSRKRDSALMNTGAGSAGNITGNVAALVPTAFIPGANTMTGAAAIGGITGLMQPSVSTEETVKNAGFGTALGPASVAAGRAAGALWEGGKALIAPFTKSGQDDIAANTLRSFAANPTKALANLRGAQPLVPGSTPTMAQASGDTGLAQLERTLANNQESSGSLLEQYANQRAARLKAVQDVAGTDEYYHGIKEGRSIFANQDYGDALLTGIDKDMAAALKPQIKSLMERPSIKQARAEAISLAKESGIDINKFGSVEGLDWLKKGLDNLISKASQPGSSIGDSKLRAYMQTKQDLMSVIEEVAPLYKTANDNFAQMSRQVNSMDVARDLLQKMESPLARFGAGGREMKDAYARALEQATDNVKRQTGMNKPLSDVMLPNDITSLNNVAKDMARAAAAQDAGRAVGSNTAQNLAAQNLLRRTLGPTGLPETWSESTLLQSLLAPYTGMTKLAGSERAVLERLAQAATDPADAAGLLSLVKPPRVGLLGGAADPYLPILPLGLLGYGSQ